MATLISWLSNFTGPEAANVTVTSRDCPACRCPTDGVNFSCGCSGHLYLKCLVLLLFNILKVNEELVLLLLPLPLCVLAKPAAAVAATAAAAAAGPLPTGGPTAGAPVAAGGCEDTGRWVLPGVDEGGGRKTSGRVMPPAGMPKKVNSSCWQSPAHSMIRTRGRNKQPRIQPTHS